MADYSQISDADLMAFINTPQKNVAFKNPVVQGEFSKVNPSLQQIAFNAPKPVTVTSGFRDPKANAMVGGVPTSYHQSGNALDLRKDQNSTATANYFKNSGYKVIDEGDHLHIEPLKGQSRNLYASNNTGPNQNTATDATKNTGYDKISDEDLMAFINQGTPQNIQQVIGQAQSSQGVMPPQKPAAGSAFETMTRNAQNMMSLGAGPYVRAAADTLNPFRGGFKENLQAEIDKQKALNTEHPVAATAGQIIGGLGGTTGQAFNKITSTLAPKAANFFTRGLASGTAAGVINQTQLSPDTSLEDRAKNFGMNVAMGPVADATLTGLGKAGSFVKNALSSAPIKQYGPDIIPDAINSNQVLKSKGLEIPMAPSDVSEGATKGNIQGILEASPISRGVARNFGKQQKDAADKVAFWLEGRQGLKPINETNVETGLSALKPSQLVDEEAAKNLITQKIMEKENAFQSQSNALYDKVAELSQGVKFEPSNTVKSLDAVQKEINLGVDKGGKAGQFISAFRQKFQPLSGMGVKAQAQVEFANMQALRKQINGIISDTTDANERRMLNIIRDGVSKDLDSASSAMAQSGNQEAAKALQEANQFYRQGKQQFKNDIFDQLDKLAGDNRSVKFNTVISDAIKNGEWEKISALKNIIGEDGMQPIRQQFIQNVLRGKTRDFDLLGGATKESTNQLRKRLDPINRKTIQELLGPEDAQVLEALATIGPYLRSAVQAQQPAKSWIRPLLYAGTGAATAGGTGFAAGGLSGGIAGLAAAGGANAVLAKIWYSEGARKALLSSYKPGMGQKEIQRLGQLVINSAVNSNN